MNTLKPLIQADGFCEFNAEGVSFLRKWEFFLLLSIALIFTSGLFAGRCCTKIKVPALFGMIITGIVIGPHLLNLIDPSIMNISSELRRIALIIILIRAGLSLNIEDARIHPQGNGAGSDRRYSACNGA